MNGSLLNYKDLQKNQTKTGCGLLREGLKLLRLLQELLTENMAGAMAYPD